MAALPAPRTDPEQTAEFPLLAIFAAFIVIAVVAIGFVIAMPSIGTLILALGSVIVFAIAISWMLARIIGPEG